jgi:hypothetical protein
MGEATALIVPLSDAKYFLRRAHESAKMGHRLEAAINARACIIFAWAGVEAIAPIEVRRLRKSGQKKQLPRSLTGKVASLMHDRNAPFDDAQFTRLRNYRHTIAHPPNAPVSTAPPPDSAQEHFDYCVNLSRVFYGHDLKF